MVGLPKAGKSTWARKSGYPIVSRDAVGHAFNRLTAYEAFAPENHKMLLEYVRLMACSLFNAGHETVVLDWTNIIEGDRNLWKHKDWTVEFKVVPTSLAVCLSRTEEERVKTEIKRLYAICDVPEIKGE